MGKKDNRPFWQKKTNWACLLVFLAGGLEAVGVQGVWAQVQLIASLLGLPLGLYGVADRVSK
jgi:hypothetical protein